MDGVGKIAVVAIVSVLCAVVVKRDAPALGLTLALCAVGLVLSLTLGALTEVRDMAQTLTEAAGLSPAVLTPVVKTVGIGIVTRVAAEVCRDAKESALAAATETAGTAAALVVCLPLMKMVLGMVTGLL